MWAIVAHAVALSMDLSRSLANLRQLPSQAKVRSTTRPRGRTARPSAVSERLMIAMVHWPCPDNASFSLSPAEPPSAHGCRSHGERYRMALMRSTAPSRSRMAALWTMMNSMQPGVSVMTWRLRPAILLPAVTPIVEMVPHRGEWRQTLWRHAPLTAAGSDLPDPIHHITQPGRAGPTAGPCRRQERPNQRPFFIRQIAWTAGRAAPVFNASDIGPWHDHSPSSSTRTVNHNPLISLSYFLNSLLEIHPESCPEKNPSGAKWPELFRVPE